MAEGPSLSVVIVGEDALARAGLRALAEAAGCEVEAELPSADAEPPAGATVAVVEVGAGEPIEAIRALAARLPVLVVLWSEEQAREALGAGARAVLPRQTLGARFAAALRAVAEGLLVIDPAFTDDVLRPASPQGLPLVEPLTRRESEVLALLVEGIGNRAIASRLGISEHTAKFHVNAILGKLGAQTRAEADAIAARRGLVVL